MRTYRELYFHMFRASEKALRALERQDFGAARSILLAAQRCAEDAVLSEGFQAFPDTVIKDEA